MSCTPQTYTALSKDVYAGDCAVDRCSGVSGCANTVCQNPRMFAQTRAGILNPQAYKPAEGFMTCADGECGRYTTRDARLVDSARAMQTYLDAVPYDGYVYMDDVYNPKYVPPGYNRQYTGYGDIVGGQVRYYIDPLVAPAFRNQIYNLDGTTEIDVFTTPMGKVEPMFYLRPTQGTHNNMSKDTFARDQLFFRNDITARQQRGHNKQRYEAIK